ncbi:serine/threonine protein kinase [Streptomyces sp. NPDC050560]|uniref:serine/threonine protein kinase n=1 Tax=Streptomyces sp. NPDC050560 TaxID=3365630 RepID=UPI0037AB79E4
MVTSPEYAAAGARVGPYTVLAALDPAPEQPAAASPFIGRGHLGDDTVLLFTAPHGADAARWGAEATVAHRLAVRGLLPVTQIDGAPVPRWYATPYLPVLPLPGVLAAHGGPLPERTVRALGASLAATLAAAHAQGATHAGLSPATVLVGAEGARMAGYGAARVAAPDGERRDTTPWLAAECLAPEQAAGGRPRPLGDVYALGAVLWYAATGQPHTAAEHRARPPEALRAVIAPCLARDPTQRLPADHVARALATSGSHPHATSLDAAAPFPLPGRAVAALARQSAAVLAAPTPGAAAPAHPLTAPGE